jgi:hypothetical protein
MDRIYLNQTALSLGYIALKRIRALETPTTRLPSSPLLRHISHIKILAACVEQVGPDEIIEYEINQDHALGSEDRDEPPDPLHSNMELSLEGRIEERRGPEDDVSPWRLNESIRSSAKVPPLSVIHEDEEEQECMSHGRGPHEPSFSVTQVTHGDLDDGDYSMDELYDEYNSQEDDWETASELSDDDYSEADTFNFSIPCLHFASRRRSIDADSDDDEDTLTPPNVVTSRSPPLDIKIRHPITHELSKREQYRRQVESMEGDLSKAFVEQIEDVLCHEIHALSERGMPGTSRLDRCASRAVSLCA